MRARRTSLRRCRPSGPVLRSGWASRVSVCWCGSNLMRARWSLASLPCTRRFVPVPVHVDGRVCVPRRCPPRLGPPACHHPRQSLAHVPSPTSPCTRPRHYYCIARVSPLMRTWADAWETRAATDAAISIQPSLSLPTPAPSPCSGTPPHACTPETRTRPPPRSTPPPHSHSLSFENER